MRLRAGGAQAVLFCANTPHKVYAQVARKTDIPILHIADATGIAIRNSGLKKVGLIGTLYTMEDGFIADWLKEHYGIETLVPSSAAARQELHRIVQKELSMGIFKAETKKICASADRRAAATRSARNRFGIHGIPLIIKAPDVAMPLFDTTLLHSQMAVDFIMGKQGLAHVRGLRESASALK